MRELARRGMGRGGITKTEGTDRVWSCVFAIIGAVAVSMAGCASSSASAPSVKYYVALGDSYAVGYQPSPSPHASPGYTAYVATTEHLRLENFGCGGATSDSILHTNGCTGRFGPVAATDAVAYTTAPQATAAEAFIRAHKGSIASLPCLSGATT
jgi:hypothetical protein